MNASKFVDILDSEQNRRDNQYVDYLNIIKMCDYHYNQQHYSSSVFCNQITNKYTSIYGPSELAEPIKLPRLQTDIDLLSNRLFDTSLYITKSPEISPEISPESYSPIKGY